MTQQKIIQAAYRNFSEHGYSGGSLAKIAEGVGIKKQSIYTYYKSKDELYITIAKAAMETELFFMKQFIEDQIDAPVEALYELLCLTHERFTKHESTKFFIRSTFITPLHMEKEILAHTYFYLDSLEALFENYFSKHKLTVSSSLAATSFLALLDSLYVEMFYGGQQRFQKRLHASWHVFYRGITN